MEARLLLILLHVLQVYLAILSQGMIPRFADIDPDTGNLDVDSVKSKINDNTRAILPVHFCGQPVDLQKLYRVARKGKNIWIIEDCAQSLGSEYNGDKIGGPIVDLDSNCVHENSIKCLSFQSVKTLTTVDGGAIILPNSTMYDRAKRLRWYGMNRQENRYQQDVEESGHKFIMNDVMATIGLSNFKHLENNVEKHRNNWNYYYNALSGQQGLQMMRKDSRTSSACSLFPVLVDDREGFHRMMESKGIQVDLPHGLLTKHSCVKDYVEFLEHASWFL